MKKILVVGASNYQVPAIQRVRQLGYEAYCVDYKEGQPGFTHANGYQIIDVKDKEACLAYARRLNINGVLTWGATLSLPTVSYIGEKLGLPCMPIETSNISMNKYQIRKRLNEYGLNSGGEIFEIRNKEEINKHLLKIPCVVKPSDGSGSKGVKIVFDNSELESAIQYAFEESRNNEIYVEPFISGEEFSVEAYVCQREVYIYSIMKTEFRWHEFFPEYSQTTYLDVSQDMEFLIEEEIKTAVKALGLNFGPVNFDLIVSSLDGKPYIIDVGIRNGQNLISSHIVPYSRGVDELNNNINLCLGQKINPVPIYKKYIASRLIIYKPGLIKKLRPIDKLIGKNNIVDIILRKKVGDVLPSYQTKADICGWILTEGATPEEARAWGGKGWETLKDYIIIES
ncbi:ATP-grasp domain-containing protein [Bacteroides thetaiotaomicron]|jgi:phosphoribosylglycinamide synthetase, ATP-grasp (A) domain|uniref:ATP-grasp domain-containing protein n=1 Tax=Bacteroides thetaiotaomicron TaxID=818 RepID=A0A7J5K070_BACT4|nr:ATP-grasp domain-containing protein [Bacteroides thetaiotaomicron]KAB4457299.1 ATP-grasp domain-containing protein [Bacteroides thetaiotaomicron]QUT38699.1 ATP-grasp domain protein [Bacteroides thetaiotaomicron]